jgi:aminopeptidase
MIPVAELTEYAEVVLDVSVPVQADDLVLINAEIEHAPLARELAEGAYARGARYVDIWYFDTHAKRSRVRHADTETLGEVPRWLDARNEELGERHGVLINITGATEPDLLSDVDQTRAGLDRMPGLASRYRVQMNHEALWAIVPYATKEWARTVFGEPDVDRLWAQLRSILRLDRPDPRAAWQARMDQLLATGAKLTKLGLDAVHFEGPGTDLTIGLIPQAFWTAAVLESVTGRRFQCNMPTEEVYTTPDYRRVNGVVTATRPLALAGTVVRDLALTFQDGVVTEVRASTGADIVRAHQATDPGAARLGEVAIVDGSSPVGQSGVTFFDTLLDENATCHLAWGAGLPAALPPELRPLDRRDPIGVNTSAIHTDFMVGGPDVMITGIRPNGDRIPVLVDNEWQL